MIGICIKQNNEYKYSKPLIMNMEDKDNFYGQLIRDIDYSLIVNLGDNLELYIIRYNNKREYYEANLMNKNPENFIILGKYILNIENIYYEKINSKSMIRGYISKKLDINQGVKIKFTLISEDNKDYYMSNPEISGNKNYLYESIPDT